MLINPVHSSQSFLNFIFLTVHSSPHLISNSSTLLFLTPSPSSSLPYTHSLSSPLTPPTLPSPLPSSPPFQLPIFFLSSPPIPFIEFLCASSFPSIQFHSSSPFLVSPSFLFLLSFHCFFLAFRHTLSLISLFLLPPSLLPSPRFFPLFSLSSLSLAFSPTYRYLLFLTRLPIVPPFSLSPRFPSGWAGGMPDVRGNTP